MSYYVYSTLTCDNIFAIYSPNTSHDLPVIEKSILIKGGHGVANKNLVTPQGVVTEVNDEDMALLEQDYHFRDQIKHGFIIVEKKLHTPEKIAKDMALRDGSSPKVPSDFEVGKNSEDGQKIYKAKEKVKKS